MESVQNLIAVADVGGQPNTTGDRLKRFCLSRAGLTILSFFLFFILLLCIRPKYIFKGKDKRELNYAIVFIISGLGAAAVYMIPISLAGSGDK